MDLFDTEVIMLVREVSTMKAHIAPHGSFEAFKAVADDFKESLEFAPVVDGKRVLDRYERPQKIFDHV